MRNLILSVLGLFLLAACANSQTNVPKPAIQDVDSKTFNELIASGKGIVLDVRTSEEYTEGHIKKAKLINVFDKDFEKQISTLPKDKEIYVYCEGGGRSADAARVLQKQGFKVYNLENGIDEWKKKGFPVEE